MNGELEPILERLLAAQERYERLESETRRGAGPRLVDLGYANVQDGPPPAVLEVLRDCLASPRPLDLQYTPYGGNAVARRVVAESLRRSHDLPFAWRHVVLTPGAMAALNVVFRALRDEDPPGSSAGEVIVPSPCWLDYPLYAANLGLRPVMVPLAPGTLRLDVGRIADAITPRTRALVLSQPANPTGLLYSAAELSTLADALQRRSGGRALLISDECHRDRLAAGKTFVSPATHYPNTCIVYSFGKALGIQGQRIGYAAVSPRHDGSAALARRLERLCRVTGHATPTALMQLALRRLATLPVDNAALDAARARVSDALARAGYEFPAPDGTYFLYPRSPVKDAFLFAETLARHDLLAMPAAVFHHEGHFRLCLVAPFDRLERAVRILAQVRDQSASARDAARSRAGDPAQPLRSSPDVGPRLPH
jgi:aspartate aminotransferase